MHPIHSMVSKSWQLIFLGSLLSTLVPATFQTARAEESKPATKNSAKEAAPKEGDGTSLTEKSTSGAEQVNVDSIKEKYWARGDESELGVVQNRLYSKDGKFELGVFGGFLTSDPFLQTKTLGGTLGYHFSEYFSVHFMGFKEFVSDSTASTYVQEQIKYSSGVPFIPPTNKPSHYLGTEVMASFLYGKLSLIGKAIIYYDMHLLGGLGATKTASSTYFTPSAGIGQQVYLSKWAAVRVDYRLMRYTEQFFNTRSQFDQGTIPTEGQQTGEDRTNWSNSITLGIDFLFGFGK